MSTITWGRVRRGTVWHLLADAVPEVGSRRGWCGTEEAIAEENDGLPPRGARPCRRCCEAVAELARQVLLAAQQGGIVDPAFDGHLEPYRGRPDELPRPVEDIDLVGALIERGAAPESDGSERSGS